MSTHAQTRHRALPRLNDSFENQKLHLKSSSITHAAHGAGSSSILRTFVALIIVIAVIYGLTWIVKRLKRRDSGLRGSGRISGSGSMSGDGLERIAQLPLGPNKSVALIRVGSQLHLIGVADHAVTPIHTFDQDEALELGLPVTPPGTVYTTPDTRDGPRGAGVGSALESLRRMTQR